MSDYDQLEILWEGRQPVPCVEDSCIILDNFLDVPSPIKSCRDCPWRTGGEGKALCLLATPPGQYNYDQLAEALDTPFARRKKDETYTAEEVGSLFGIGKQRALAIEKKAIAKLREVVSRRDQLGAGVRESANWIYESLPEDPQMVT